MNTILILHGWGSCAKNWNKIKELLEKRGYKVFIPDLPGFGKSTPLVQPRSIDDYVDWLENYCKENNISMFYLLGHSFGGSIATKFIIRNLEKVQKLFLVGCAGIRKKTFKKEVAKKIAKSFKVFKFFPFYSLIRKALYKLILRSDYLTVKNSIMKETYQNIINEDISKQFSKISVPTVIIWGKKDKLTPIKDAYYIKEAISGAKLEVLPGIFHNPQSENPKLLVNKIIENC